MDKFTYLGSVVSKKGGTDENIQARIGKAKHSFAMLRPTNMTVYGINNYNQVESLWVKCEGYVLHDSETWRLTEGLKQKLQVFINKSPRSFGDKQNSDR